MVRRQAPGDMTIAALARAGGVGVETIRYHQRRGLLAVPDAAAGTGSRGATRRYANADVQRLRFIRSAKAAGFSLDEVAGLLRLDGEKDRGAARALARERLARLDEKLAELSAARAWLARLKANCAAGAPGHRPILSAFEDAARRPS